MLHVLLVMLVLVVLMRDNLAPGRAVSLVPGAPAWLVVVCSLVVYALPALILLLPMRSIGKGLDRTGRVSLIRLADRLCQGVRWGAFGSHLAAVYALGWLDAVRAIVGDVVAVDELIALLPALGVIVASWWAMYPIDRRLREAGVMSALDHGHDMPRMLTRWQFVGERVRHEFGLVLVPVVLMMSWWEGTDRAAVWAAGEWPRWVGTDWWEWGLAAVQFAGALVILGCMPLVLVKVWRTARLGEGELRDRLEALCRAHGVKVRRILVWRTHDAVINGALVGVLPWARYILLTESLLERMPMNEVEAVMAHEVGHARRHHLVWLVLAIIGAAGAVSIVLEWLVGWLVQARLIGAVQAWMWLATLGTLGAAVWTFGHVSRRFEQQADAFAAQHLSGERWNGDEEERRVTPEAAGSMARALGSVAILNRMDPGRFTFRHGSIRARQRRLARLVGMATRSLPIDRRVRVIKAMALVSVGLVVAMMVWG